MPQPYFMPDLTLPDALVERMDSQPERIGPFHVSRNRFGAAIIGAALDARDLALSASRKKFKRGPKLATR